MSLFIIIHQNIGLFKFIAYINSKFNHDFSRGKLKHLEYDETDQTLHLKKTKSDKDEELQRYFYSQLPLRDIAEILRFVNESCKYSSAFTHVQLK